jgi:hypothetical protein
MRDWITALTLLTMGSLPGAAMAQERPWGWGMHPGPWMWGAGGLLTMRGVPEERAYDGLVTN